MKLTKKQQAVVDYMFNSDKCCHRPITLVDLVYSKETQDKYSYPGRIKPVIDYLICCYIGKMAAKGILRNICVLHHKSDWLGRYKLSQETINFLNKNK